MNFESEADRLALLDALGGTLTVGATTISAIVERLYAEASPGEQGVDLAIARATVRTSDVTSVTRGTTVVDGSTSYKVVSIQPDGTGMTVLVLEDA